MRILSVSSSRADVYILAPLWRALADMPGVDLHVFLTGMHVSDDSAAREALPGAAVRHRGGADIAGAGGAEAAAAMARILADAAAIFADTAPDCILLMGDRLDMIPAALAALPMNLPVAHLHGGELSQGVLDDRARHAMTKLAHVHCVSTVAAAQRLCRMGEEPWRVHVTGAPGLDTLVQAAEIDAATLAAALGLPDMGGLRLVTVHPETNSEAPLAPLDAVLDALDRSPAPTLFTAPNADPGGAEARARIEAFAAGRDWAVFCDTLGARYASVLRHAAVMVGNSSSGIIEAALFGLPVIDVGRRQDGRARDANVHNCLATAGAVHDLLHRLTAPGAPRPPAGRSLYGDGRAAPRIAAVLTQLPERPKLLFKRFFDGEARFEAPWDGAVKAVG